VDTRAQGRPDAELVQAALAGDRAAIAELLARHWDTAVFLAARVLGSPELARDAAQEAAIAAMTDLARLRSPDRFGAWFCGIALNVSRRWRRQLGAEVPLPAGHPAEQPGPDEAAEAAELRARVRRAVAALPAGQRAAVWLFYLQGLSHREVAAELEISIGAVKARLHQARAALGPRLAPIMEHQEVQPMTTASASRWLDADVAEIRRTDGDDPQDRNHVMILQERGGSGRRLPIWIAAAEAGALAVTMEAVETPRPFTARLAASLVEAAGGQIDEVRITRLLDKIFYAATIVRGAEGTREVDSRPSDAVNLALVAGAPIRVDAALFGASDAVGMLGELEPYPPATADIAAAVSARYSRPATGT
jgi:RNA polymerase sigma factor (sigma-70 family)